MLRPKVVILLSFLLSTLISVAQDQTSTISGEVIDKQSGFTIPGANVVILSMDPVVGASTDMNGKFSVENVPAGRHTVQVSFLGYKSVTIPNVLVYVGKESYLTIEMLENVEKLKEVVISAEAEKRDPINPMATVSARQFSVEEAARYSGALQDPARMATNFAGVSGANDGRNDIIIRGNSPIGVLWRLEGIDIPSPNHFASLGTTGGPVSMLNLNNLSNSDFMTGAWSADYGNAVSGVFDLKLREGNSRDYNFLGQVGFNGFEFGAEGPWSKKNKNGSFLVNYRYSTLGVFDALGVSLGTGGAVPQYQDITFKTTLPTKNAGKFTVFGIGGTSYIEFLGKDADTTQGNLYSDRYQDARYGSTTGVLGASHAYFLDKNTLSKLVLAVSYTSETGTEDSLSDDYSQKTRSYGRSVEQMKYSANYKINKKLNARNTLTTGIIYDHYRIDMLDSVLQGDRYVRLTDVQGDLDVLQVYYMMQHRFGANWTMNWGLHNQTLIQNVSNSFEPRVGVKYQPFEKHTFSVGTGLHSQMQPMFVYFAKDPDGIVPGNTNTGLDFTKSAQFVFGYDYNIGNDWRFKTELYYQNLFDVPVESVPSSYSVLNEGADFGFQNKINLVNTGTGYNYGAEFTVEKFFTKGYYFLSTLSLFESKYEGSDKVERNTAFNSNYVLNLLGGKEFKMGKKFTLSLDTKVNLAGGRRYTPIDLNQSIADGEEVRDDNLAFSEQFDPYFRWDFKITFRHQGKKISQQFAVDLQNLTNQQNIFGYGYDRRSQTIATTYQRGFFPDVQYKIYF